MKASYPTHTQTSRQISPKRKLAGWTAMAGTGRFSRLLTLLVAGVFFTLSPSAFAAWTIKPIAVSATAAPDSGADVKFLNFSRGTMNAAGDVAFVGTLSGPTVGVQNDTGIYLFKNGALHLVLRRGQDVPGLADGTKLTDVSQPFTDVILAGNGSMLVGSVTRKDSVPGYAVLTGQPDSMQLTALNTDAAPGTEVGTTYGTISRLCFTENGKAGFLAILAGPAITGTNFSAIYTGTHGALAVAVRSGQTAPNANGAVFFGFPPGLQLNNEGRFILPCTLTGNGVTANSSNAFYAGLPGALQLIARQGAGAGGKLYAGSPGAPYQSSGGKVLFDYPLSATGSLADAGGADADRALFGGTSGDIAIVVRSFDPGPGEPGITIRPGSNGILTAGSIMNDAGTIALNTFLIGTTQDDPFGRGVYVGPRDNVVLLARSGQRAPGTPNGVVFKSVGANEITEAGDVLMGGFLAGTGVTPANDEGFWVGRPGNLQLVVRKGMSIDVGSGTKKTIATVRSISDFNGIGGRRNGRTSGFNEARQVFLSLTFTDNSQGLFRADADLAGTPSTLTVTANSGGKLTGGFLGATQRTVGKKYTVTATPDTGLLFDGWTGGITSLEKKLTFTMTPDLMLQANFIANPFIPVAGNYAGLITTTPATFAGGGLVNIKATPAGAFSGTLIFGGRKFRIKSAFDHAGHVTFGIPKTTISITLTLAISAPTGTVVGTITDGSTTAAVNTNLAIFTKANPTPLAGTFNVLLPLTGQNNDLQSAIGHGYAQITVKATGASSLVGKLSDGTALTAASSLNADGTLPVFALLYKKTGSLGGVVTFRTQATSGVDGPLDWFRPGLAVARLGLHGSRYVKPAAGGRALDLMNGLGKLRFSGGAIFATPVEKNLTIGTDNLVSFDAPDGTTLKIKTTSGLLSGKFVSPPGTKPKSFSGILQQAAKMGGGAYSGTAQTGLVELLPR